MPNYKLYYFESKGLGEMIRLLFAEAGVPFEDVRYNSDSWPKHKQEMLFGQMPVLEVDGEQIAHSRAAFRYLAREFNLMGADSMTSAQIDMWIEVVIEGVMKLPFGEKDEEVKKQKSLEVMKEIVFPKLEKLEAVASKTAEPYLFGGNVTALDIFLFAILDVIKDSVKNEEMMDKLPVISKALEQVENRPKIAEWIKKRPVTEH